jgi:hypothetical protein
LMGRAGAPPAALGPRSASSPATTLTAAKGTDEAAYVDGALPSAYIAGASFSSSYSPVTALCPLQGLVMYR